MAKPLTLITPAVTLAAQSWGEPDAPAVLALHGWLDNSASFQPLSEQLTGLQLIALDLAGHGHSAWRPAGSFYHFIDYVNDVIAVADALGLQQFQLLGHSLGAGIAGLVAAAIPERVEKLILIDGIGPLSGAVADTAARLRKAIQAQSLLATKKMTVYASIEQAAQVRQQVTGLSLASAELIVQRNLKQHANGFIWRSDPRLTLPSPYYFSEPQIQVWLRAIRSPSLLIRALDGLLIKRPEIAARCACINPLQQVELAGNHHLHMEQPAHVAQAVQEFLAQ